MSVVGTAVFRLLGDASKFTAEMQAAGNKFQQVGKKMQSAGRSMTMGLTVPILGVGAAIVKTGVSFEAEMSKIVGLVGVSRDQVDRWSKDLIKLGPELGKSPQELAEALFFVTSAGFRGAEALDVLTLSAKASSAGLGETATVADAVTSAVNAYGPGILSAADATDILTAAVREGKLEASALAPVLGNVLPTASALGISFEDVAGQLAVLSRTGTDAANGATQLNSVMTFLLKTSSEGEEILAGQNLSLEKLRETAAGPGGLISVMRLLNETYEGDLDTLAKIIPNTRAFRGVMTNLAQEGDVVDGVLQGVADSTGALDDAFAAAQETAEFKLNASMSELKGSLITLGVQVIPMVVSGVSALTGAISKVATWFSNLSAPMQKTIIIFAGIVAAIGPLIVIAGSLVSAIGVLLPALGSLALAIAGITWPITLTIAAIAALIVAGLTVVKHWNVISFEARRMGQAIKDAIVGALDWVIGKVKDFAKAVAKPFAWLKDKIVGNSIVPDMMALLEKEFKGLDKLMVAPAEEAAQKVNEAFRNIANPEALKAMDFNVTIDADELYEAVIEASGRASVAIRALSATIPPPAAAFIALYKEIITTEKTTRDWAKAVEDARLAELDLHHALLTQKMGVVDITAKTAEFGRMQVSMSAAGQAGMDRYLAAQERGKLALQAYEVVTKGLGLRSEQVAYKFQNLKRSAASVIADFTPMGLIAKVFGSALKALEPALTALQAPFEVLGVIIARAVMPILKALFPIFKSLALALTYVLEGAFMVAGVFFIVTGFLQRAIGSFVYGLGKMLSKIPLIGGLFKPLKAAGKAMRDAGQAGMDLGKGFMEASKEIGAGREEIKALEWPEEADAAAEEQKAATEGTTEAITGQTEVITEGHSAIGEVLVEIRDGVLSIRDLLAKAGGAFGGVSAALKGGGISPDTLPFGGGSLTRLPLQGLQGQGGNQMVDVAPGAVIIQSAGPVSEEDGRAAARGFMDELSGENFSRTQRLVSGSGRVDAPLATE